MPLVLIQNIDERPGHNIMVQEVYSNGQEKAGSPDVVGPDKAISKFISDGCDVRIRSAIDETSEP